MRCARPDRDAGFTLVEMLVAIAIFGVMAGAGYRALDTVLVTRERVTEDYRRWREVARAVAWIERDFEAIQARPVRGPADQVLAPLHGIEALAPLGQPVATFTRSGALEASGLMMPPRRIGYRVRDGALERLAWPAPDPATHAEPSVTVVLRGVSTLGLRFRDAAGTWRAQWPPVQSRPDSGSAHTVQAGAVDTTLPTGVDVTIELAGGERIRRLVPLPAGARS